MPISIDLPKVDRSIQTYVLQNPEYAKAQSSFQSQYRKAISAAHVVADPLADVDPVQSPAIDWDATLQYRHYLWSLGLSVAEAMDTAQRGMGLQWSHAKELITRSVKEAKAVNGEIACGVGTDHLTPTPSTTIDEVIHAYEEQCAHVEAVGGKMIIMASRALAACATSANDYEKVYGRILSQASEPVILHWLGDMFDPNLKGYWGSEDLDEAMGVCLRIIRENDDKVDGIKISLLDKDKEIKMRRALPRSVRMYSGDDFNYPELIQGDEQGYSDALLGIFDAIAPAAASALNDLDRGKVDVFREKMDKTVPLARHIFQKPTFSYKTGVVFLAYLNGHQSHFRMIGGAESARSTIHFARLFELADQGNVLTDPVMATERMKQWLVQSGVRQTEAAK
ncbi:dihydrodipicolinate synthase family protein [Salicibibacter halophilus]|uniref:Dihydrodipicolinate synthase family protein n=1 Tax=Salicibibacter halophilus TaxID=2502791 RepID=A0A514LK78_9BACI|nr:dihydrodipicolinate synthase family protein [Salicibibacter halophilus]QDI92213.1 dihydrodipicolinate synthase family protein [Salicibibacter halophilus]